MIDPCTAKKLRPCPARPASLPGPSRLLWKISRPGPARPGPGPVLIGPGPGRPVYRQQILVQSSMSGFTTSVLSFAATSLTLLDTVVGCSTSGSTSVAETWPYLTPTFITDCASAMKPSPDTVSNDLMSLQTNSAHLSVICDFTVDGILVGLKKLPIPTFEVEAALLDWQPSGCRLRGDVIRADFLKSQLICCTCI